MSGTVVNQMRSPKSTRKKSQQCAARVMEAVPLVMRFIRADMRAINATDMPSIWELPALLPLPIPNGWYSVILFIAATIPKSGDELN